MDKNLIIEEIDNRVQLIKLNRPQSLNALSKNLLFELSNALAIAEKKKKYKMRSIGWK